MCSQPYTFSHDLKFADGTALKGGDEPITLSKGSGIVFKLESVITIPNFPIEVTLTQKQGVNVSLAKNCSIVKYLIFLQ